MTIGKCPLQLERMALMFGMLCSLLLSACGIQSESDIDRPTIDEGFRTDTTPEPSSTPLLFYVDGCNIPLPPDRKTKGRSTRDWNVERVGKVAVTSTVYEARRDFTFTRQTFVVPSENRSVPGRHLRLVWIEELKVGDHIFGYNIFAEPTGENISADNSVHGHRTSYTCYDSDGDGKFEYLINNSGVPPPVPMWVVSAMGNGK